MKFFIDTANFEEIKEAHAWGIFSGVTTNPSLVAKENVSFHDRLREITALVDGSVSAEVIALDAEGMIKEGRELSSNRSKYYSEITNDSRRIKSMFSVCTRRH